MHFGGWFSADARIGVPRLAGRRMLSGMKRYDLFLNGQSVPAAAGKTFSTTNPADTRETAST